mgnify:CR=1 FL=1
MSQFANRFLATIAAICIAAVSMSAVVAVPAAEPATFGQTLA